MSKSEPDFQQLALNLLKSINKKAEPPMAKPPSGVNMATKVPTSAPKAPKMGGGMPKMAKDDSIAAGGDVSIQKGVLSDIATKDAESRGAPVHAVPAKHTKMPSPEEHAVRAATHQAAMQGAFQPKGPVQSGLELARPPGRPGVFGRISKLGKAALVAEKRKVSITPPTQEAPALKPAGQKYHTVAGAPGGKTIPGAGPAGTRTQVPLGGSTGNTTSKGPELTATVATPGRQNK
jgi:hypothetical protein